MTDAEIEKFCDDNYRFIQNFCKSKFRFTGCDGEDAMQGAITKIVQNRHKYSNKHNCSFRTWACYVAKNHCIDFLKIQQSIAKRTVSFDALPPHKAENIVRQEFVDYLEEEQEQKICEEENLNNLNAMLDLLSEKDRKIVLLKYEHGSKKAAQILNLTDANVRKISSRAVITFKKMLKNK